MDLSKLAADPKTRINLKAFLDGIDFVRSEQDTADFTMAGLIRFTVAEELEPRRGYRRAAVDWERFAADCRVRNDAQVSLGRDPGQLAGPNQAVKQRSHLT